MNQTRSDAGRMPQSKADEFTSNCLFLVRSLRARAYKLHEDIFTSLEEKESAEDMRRRLVPLCIKLNKNYDQLEGCANNLPEKINSDKAKMERLKYLFQEEQIDTAHSEVIDKLLRACNYNEGHFQVNLFISNFMATSRRRQYSMIPHSVSYSKFDKNNNPHAIFENLLIGINKELQAKKSGISINILERSCYSCVFEIRSGTFMQNSRREFVCLQKAVVLENGGSIDRINFYAPNEDLVFMDDFGEKRVDMRISSRYEVYRRLSTTTNIFMLNNAPITEPRGMSAILSWISKVHTVMETPCKVCKKVLKDFLPPTSFNPQNIRHTQHDTCR